MVLNVVLHAIRVGGATGEDGHGSGYGSDEELDLTVGEDYVDDSIHAFQGHSSSVYAVAWNPTSSDMVATGGGDDVGFIWRVGEDAFMENSGDVFELRGHTDTVTSVQFNVDGSLLATGGMDGCVKIWDAQSGTCKHTLDGPAEAIDWVQWHPKGNVLLAGSSDFSAWMWSGQTGDFMMTFTGHHDRVTCGSFTPDGKTVITCGGENDCSMRVWDPRSGQAVVCLEGTHFHGTAITSLGIHPNGQTVLTGSEAGTLKLASIEGARIIGSLEGHADGTSIEGIAFVQDMPVAATAGMDGKLIVWDMASCAKRLECQHTEVRFLFRDEIGNLACVRACVVPCAYLYATLIVSCRVSQHSCPTLACPSLFQDA